ncbi:hypothetical protein GIB67_026719 [Kingdonia uniflora]|uniref:Uncharacterized protein n=1 Tax=Kingdonia uniflora TaxID=39325 RepID=A0A7J7MH84_9MAGN|nr:hypothetical protein GIB67_026719 [Kingdonia uniflora]
MLIAVKKIGLRLISRRRKLVLKMMKKMVWVSLQLKARALRISSCFTKPNNNRLLNYDMFSYSKNFDDGKWQLEEEEFFRSRSFSYRSKSMTSLGEFAGKWWDWGWGWILSRKPMFARDLELNEEESTLIGSHNKGSWRHVFFKARAELKRLVVGSDHVGAPQTFRYDSYSYSQNFDGGKIKRSES